MTVARPVLVIDSNHHQRVTLISQLVDTGIYAPVGAADLAEARSHIDAPEARFDLIILDMDLPDGDGRDFCAQLRQRGERMPLMMVGTSSSEADVVAAFASGANDYIRAPFRPKELLARCNAQLRIFDNSEHAVFTIGSFTFRPAAKLLVSADKKHRIRMTAKEVLILKYLYRCGDRPVPRNVLLNAIWGYNADVTTHTLETHIYRLRQKIESASADSRLLLTAPGGYRLQAAA